MLTKIAVLVSGGGTNLQALIDAQQGGIIKSGKIEVVIASNPDAYAIKRAENSGIPAEVVNKKECSSQDEFESGIINDITNLIFLVNNSFFFFHNSANISSIPFLFFHN